MFIIFFYQEFIKQYKENGTMKLNQLLKSIKGSMRDRIDKNVKHKIFVQLYFKKWVYTYILIADY